MFRVLHRTTLPAGSAGQVEASRVTYSNHAFPRHWDPYYVIQAVESGTVEFWCSGSTWRAGRGSLILLHPSQVHTGSSPSGSAVVYSSLYPSEGLVQKLVGDRSETGIVFRTPVVHAPREARMIIAAIRDSQRPEPATGQSTSFVTRLVDLFGRFSTVPAAPPVRHSRIEQARDLLRRAVESDISIDELAREVGLSSYHLIRSFRDAFGIPPHRYLMNLRVHRAAELIREGVPVARTAAECGFADQSHLGRCMRRLLGVTPGQLRDRARSF